MVHSRVCCLRWAGRLRPRRIPPDCERSPAQHFCRKSPEGQSAKNVYGSLAMSQLIQVNTGGKPTPSSLSGHPRAPARGRRRCSKSAAWLISEMGLCVDVGRLRRPPASGRSRRDRLIGALECNFTPRDVWANAQAQGSDHLDHERDITLAIHAAIPDFVGKQPIATTYRLAAQITAARRCYKSKGPFDDR